MSTGSHVYTVERCQVWTFAKVYKHWDSSRHYHVASANQGDADGVGRDLFKILNIVKKKRKCSRGRSVIVEGRQSYLHLIQFGPVEGVGVNLSEAVPVQHAATQGCQLQSQLSITINNLFSEIWVKHEQQAVRINWKNLIETVW